MQVESKFKGYFKKTFIGLHQFASLFGQGNCTFKTIFVCLMEGQRLLKELSKLVRRHDLPHTVMTMV